MMVKMYHNDPIATAGPTEADVPEEGIPMMRSVGWFLADEAKKVSVIDGMTVAEMREYAKGHMISIPAMATTKAEIAAIINKG